LHAALVALAACVLAWPAAAAAAAAPALQASLGSATFPARTIVLSVPAASLSSSAAEVTEDGRPVTQTTLTPLTDAAPRDFGVVLAIDVSGSMKGRSIHQAIAAARAIAAQRTGQQQLGVIVFNDHPRVLLPLSSDPNAIAGALGAVPTPTGGTAIYDALTLAIQQLQQAHIAARSVILLSDGTDHGSTVSEASVAAAARAAHITLDTVGIRSASFDPRSLEMLARDGGGRFHAANADQLVQLFTSLLSGLTHRYVVHYLSDAKPGSRVNVTVGVDGVPGTAALAYEAPRTPAVVVNPPKPKVFWVSTLASVAAACVAAVLAALAVLAVLMARRRRHGLRQRIAQFTAHPVPAGVEPAAAETKRQPHALERFLERMSWWPRFKQMVDVVGFTRSAADLVAIDLAVTVAAALLIAAATGTPVLMFLILPIGIVVLRSLVRHRLRKQQQLFGDQLPAHLEELASAMRAGHALVPGLNAMVKSAAEPSRREWSRVLADEQLGMPLDRSLSSLATRMNCTDVEHVALVAAMHRRTGGNMAEVLDRLAEGVRERAELRRELRALTAQVRLSRWVVTCLPPALLAAISAIDPSFMRPLFHSSGGIVVLAIAAVLVVLGSLVMRALTDIKV
jgi:tight adherence protein B